MSEQYKDQPIISWGIIGCGNVTENKSGPAFHKADHSALHAVMRRDAAKAADYAMRHHVPRYYSDAFELINDQAINAVYIATPPKFHEEYAVAALQQGKYVYVEKPVTLNVDSCKRMMVAVKKYDGKLTVAHYRRALPMFLQIKKMIDEKSIGNVKTIRLNLFQPDDTSLVANSEVNWRVVPEIAGGGLFFDLAPHQLDMLIYIFGKAIHYSGISVNQSKKYNAEDAVAGIIHFAGDIICNGNWNFSMPDLVREDSCIIFGETGYLQFSFFGNEIKWVTDLVNEVFNFIHPQHIQQPMIQKTVHYFLGKEDNPCSLEAAFNSLEIMQSFVQMKPAIPKP